MIRHRPHGLGHPYAATADQRLPALPIAGRHAVLGVEALDGTVVARVDCEWEQVDPAGAPAVVLPMTSLDAREQAVAAAAMAGGEGHLADAQAALLRSGSAWAVTSPELGERRRYRYRFHATADDGSSHVTEWFDVAAASWVVDPALDAGLTVPRDKLVAGSVRWLVSSGGAHRVRFALQLSPDEHVVGFGERFDRLDQRGSSLDAVVFEQYKSQGVHGRTYLPMPFAHVVGEDGDGWGFHVRTNRRTWYDVAATEPDRLVVEVDLGLGAPRLDVAVYRGGPVAVLDAFLAEVGRAQELPDWVFRLWASGNEWNTQDIVLERMDRHRDEDVPVGVVVVEAWSDEEGITIFRDARYDVRADGSAHSGDDFSYPPDGAWPDPARLVRELHDRGIKVVLWQIPLLKTPATGDVLHEQALADGEAMVREGHAVLQADGTPYLNRGWWFPQALMPDLTTQSTRDWWTAKRRYLVRDLDVDGFKTDGGEHAWGHDLRYGDGSRGDDGNNLFPVHYARAFGDLLRSEGKAPVTFSRAGFTGSQAHGLYWAGDEDSTWQAFESSVTAGLTVSACGIVYWSWDLAGFSGPVPDAELYLRAAAASTFMPVMQYHSEFNHHQRPLRDRTPWHVAETNNDPDVVPVFRRYARLRDRLVPYLSEQAAVSVRTSRPLMRALFFDFGDDARVWRYPRQFLLGDDLLVSPVTEPGVTTWTTYLPRGRWVDVWSGQVLDGGTEIVRDVPRDVVPVYCRASRWPDLAGVFEPDTTD